MNYMELSCIEYARALSSADPVPGGGSASALVGSIAMSLGQMVGSLTLGKKKYKHVEKEIEIFMQRARDLKKRMMALAEEDAKVFEPLAAAYRMPKTTPEEIEEKERVMEKVLKDACDVPLEIMETCCEAIDLLKEFAHKGTEIAISDAGVGAVFAKAALEASALNVFINTKAMKNKKLAQAYNKEANMMLLVYKPKADYVYGMVENRLRY